MVNKNKASKANSAQLDAGAKTAARPKTLLDRESFGEDCTEDEELTSEEATQEAISPGG